MKRLTTLVFAVICSVILVGCGVTPEPIDNDLLEMEDYTTLSAEITFAHAMGQDKQAVIARLIAEFNQVYPNITVTQVPQGGYPDLLEKTKLSLQTDDTPTIVQAYPDHIADYLEAKGVRSLDKFISHDKVGLSAERIADYVASYYEEGFVYDASRTLYCLPFNKSSENLYFNATWFEKHGLLSKYNLGTIQTITYGSGASAYQSKVFVPSANAHLTWQDIEEIGKYYVETEEYKAKSDKEKDTSAAIGIDSEANFFISLVQQRGGVYSEFDSKGKGVFRFFDDPVATQTLAWYKGLHDKGYAGMVARFGTTYCSDAFKAQQVIMTTGSSAGGSYNEPGKTDGVYNFTYGVLPYPQQASSFDGSGNPIYSKQEVIQQGTNVALMKCKTNTEEMAGWLFLKYISNDPNAQFIWSMGSGYNPTIKSVWEMQEYSDWINGISRVGGNIVESEPTISARSIIFAQQQAPAYYTNVAFVGTSTARNELPNLLNKICFGGTPIPAALADSKATIELGMRN